VLFAISADRRKKPARLLNFSAFHGIIGRAKSIFLSNSKKISEDKALIPLKRSLSYLLITAFCLTAVLLFASCRQTSHSEERGEYVEYYSMWKSGEPQAEYLMQMAEAFEKEAGIKIKLLFAGRDVLTKVKSRAMMEDPPDLVDQDFNELSAAISIGSLKATDIEAVFYKDQGPEGQNRLMDLFQEEYLRLYEKNGRLCLFPYEFITSGFFYDKKLYEENGIHEPKVWDEFIQNGDVLSGKGIAPLAQDGNINFYNAYYFAWAVERVLGPGAFKKAAEDRSGNTWDEPGYLEAARMVYSISNGDKGYFQKGYDLSEWPTAQIEWAQGKYGNILCATWIPMETKGYTEPAFEYGFYPFPQVKNGKGKTGDVEIGFIGCAIPQGAENAEGAISFLKFMLKKENARKFCDRTNTISARKDVEYPLLLAPVHEYVRNIQKPYKSYDGVWADLPGWWAKFLTVDDKLIFGKIPPEEFIKEVKEQSVAFWQNKK
jgi:raffinose/stachyose/melibiose transport system substrate-binding protein